MTREVVRIQDQEDTVRLRREGGAWLRSLREAAGLTQRELANAIGVDYYTFVSQLEAGRGRVPPAHTEAWAKAVGIPPRELVLGMMKYFEPIWYDLLTRDGAAPAPKPAGNGSSVEELEARLAKLEKLVGPDRR